MKIRISQYYRCSEQCNWQLDTSKEKEITKEQWNFIIHDAGFKYSSTYKEAFHIYDQLYMRVIQLIEE